MVSYRELLYIVLVSMLFILTFKIQGNIFPKDYFSNSQIILEDSLTYKKLVVRYIIIFIFGSTTFFIFNNLDVVLLGTFLGSFLIIWPTLLSPSKAYSNELVKRKDMVLIYIVHLIFVLTSIITVYISIQIFPILKQLIYNKREDIIYDILKLTVISIIGVPVEKNLMNLLNKRVKKNRDMIER